MEGREVGYIDDEGRRWLSCSEAAAIWRGITGDGLSESSYRRRARDGTLGVIVEQKIPGYFRTDEDSLLEYLLRHCVESAARAKVAMKRRAKERAEWEADHGRS